MDEASRGAGALVVDSIPKLKKRKYKLQYLFKFIFPFLRSGA